MEAYDSSTDPYDDLESFKAIMMLQEMFDALMSKPFLATFKEATRAWYTRLPPNSIDSFKEFGQKVYHLIPK